MVANPFRPVVDLPSGQESFEDTLAGLDASSNVSQKVPLEIPEDLSSVTTRYLRVLSNRLFKELDTDFPQYGTQEDFAQVVEELSRRESLATGREREDALQTSFRDNSLRSRFELFRDGIIVASLTYTLRAGQLTLRNTVVVEDYLWQGMESEIVRRVLLNAHRRRLAVVPYCAHAQAFLNANPRFRRLVSTRRD